MSYILYARQTLLINYIHTLKTNLSKFPLTFLIVYCRVRTTALWSRKAIFWAALCQLVLHSRQVVRWLRTALRPPLSGHGRSEDSERTTPLGRGEYEYRPSSWLGPDSQPHHSGVFVFFREKGF